MKNLFESLRRYGTLTEEQLLAEGRKEDAAKKYPHLGKKRESLDGESVLDTLIQADPSGNQKYLMGAAKLVNTSLERAKKDGYDIFWAKKWPTEAEMRELPGGGRVTSPINPGDTDNLVSAWGVARNVSRLLPQFHELQPHILKDRRDINAFEDWAEFSTSVAMAAQRKRDKQAEKERSRELKRQAREQSEVIADNDRYTMIRPTTEHASCYYGKGTKWCISATEATNYFDEYTNEGKSFYFVFLANLSAENPASKLAMVVTVDGRYDETFDATDESLYHAQVLDAIVQSLLNEKADAGALEVYRAVDGERHVDELSEADKADYMKMIKELDVMYEWDDELAATEDGFLTLAEQSNHNLRVVAEQIFQGMKQEAIESHMDDPPGASSEQFEALKDTYNQAAEHIHVELEFPYDTGASQVMWGSHAFVDVEGVMYGHPLVREKRLKWRVNIEDLTEEQEGEIREAVDAALNDVNIYPDEMSNEVGLEFHIDLERDGGSLSEFDGFLDHTLDLDQRWSEGFVESLLDALEERELIGRDTREEEYWPDPEEKKKQMELPLQESRSKIRVIIKS
jgi:hypothetical protein